jgi:glycine betaine/choline ABC-type transport system substrate-binding protein
MNATIDKVNAALTIDEYNKLALQVQDQKLDPKDVAAAFLRSKGLA